MTLFHGSLNCVLFLNLVLTSVAIVPFRCCFRVVVGCGRGVMLWVLEHAACRECASGPAGDGVNGMVGQIQGLHSNSSLAVVEGSAPMTSRLDHICDHKALANRLKLDIRGRCCCCCCCSCCSCARHDDGWLGSCSLPPLQPAAAN